MKKIIVLVVGFWVLFNLDVNAQAPLINSFSPTNASIGNTITINGKYFTGITNVSFGGVAASNFSLINDSTITAIVGTGASGSVSVTTANGSKSLSGFIYCVTPITHIISLSGCISVIYKAKTYKASSVIRDTIKTLQGCDSIYNIANIVIGSLTTYAYVINADSTILIINLATNKVVATILVGLSNFAIATSPDGTRVYVTDNSYNKVNVINTANNAIIATIPVGLFPDGIAVSPDGSRVYVTHQSASSISVINTLSNSVIAIIPVGVSPYGVAVSPDGIKVYVANYDDNTVSVINALTNKVIATIAVGTAPFGVVVSPDGTRLYVTNNYNSSVSVVNTANNTVIATIPVGSFLILPTGICISPDGSRVYVANNGVNNVSVINTTTNTVIATVVVGNKPSGISISSDGTKVYVINSNSISVIKTSNNTVSATISGLSSSAFGNFITNVGPNIKDTIITGCNSILYKGNVYTTSSIVRDTVRTLQGCDSIFHNVNIQVVKITAMVQMQTISGCNSVVYNGITFTNSTIYNDTLRTIKGCDSIYRKAIIKVYTVVPSIHNINLTGCDNIVYKGILYDNSTIVKDTIRTLFGCDSIYNVTFLQIRNKQTFAYCANYNHNSVSVVNTTNNTVVAIIPVGDNPCGVSVSSDGKRVYVANNNNGANSISVINTLNNQVFRTITVGYKPIGVIVSPDGTKIYVTNNQSNDVSVISTYDYTVVATIPVGIGPYGICLNSDGSKLYVANSSRHSISVINTSTNTVLTTINCGNGPFGVCLSPNDSKLYVTNYDDSTVNVISTATNTIISTIPVGTNPQGVCVNADDSRLYVANYGSGNISVINTLINSTIATIATGYYPYGLSITPDGSKVYICCRGTDAMFILNTSNNILSSLTNVGLLSPSSFGNFIANVPLTRDGYQISLTSCNNIVYNGINYTKTTIVTDTIKTSQGCDSLYKIATLTIGNKSPNAYIANTYNNKVSVINCANNTIVANISVGSSPKAVSVSPDGTRVYVINSSNISVIDAINNTLITQILAGLSPYAAVVSPDGTRLYVANQGSNSVSVINTSNNTVVKTVAVGSYPFGICLSPDGTKVYVTNNGSNTVSVINTITNTVIATIAVGNRPYSICTSPDGTKVYVTNKGTNMVSVIDANTNTVTANVMVGNQPKGICINTSGTRLYVTNNGNNTVSVINTINNSIVATVNVGIGPTGISVTSDDTRVYVVNYDDSSVNVINTQNNTIIFTLKGFNHPQSFGNFIANTDKLFGVTNIINLSDCNNVVYKGINYTSNTVLKDTLKSVQGCDSIYNNINITITNAGISGNIKTSLGLPIKLVTSNYNNLTSLILNSTYNYPCLSSSSPVKIRLSKNNDIKKNNGVTAIDIILTQRHILNTTKLNSPYKIIAADVNNDKSLSNIDVILMKRLILGIDTTFKGNRLWAFVDSAYQFPDTTNPFPYKDSISFTNLTSNKTNQSFIGVKLGDVNYDWNPVVARGVATKALELIVDELRLENDELRIPVSVKNFKDLTALQYTLHFDNSKYEFVAIRNNKLDIEYNSTQANASGNISFLWADTKGEEKSLEDGSEVFTLVLKPKELRIKNDELRTEEVINNLQLTINNSITEIEAWDKDNLQHNIILTKQTIQQEPQTQNTKQWVVSPNPNNGNITVELFSKVNHLIKFELTNEVGKTLYIQSVEAVKGNNVYHLNLNKNSQLSSGIYFIKAIGMEQENVKKVFINP